MNEDSGSKGISKAAWLLMLREGGRWRPTELMQRIDLGDIGGTLTSLSNNGFARRYQVRTGSEYGVTLQCKVPMGVTLAELVEAGALHVKQDEQPASDAPSSVASSRSGQ